jgi:tetratricopeptide (TPR) repeat protein
VTAHATPESALRSATAALRTGDVDGAERLARAALEQFARRADADGRMRASNLLGAIAFERGELDDAERAFGEALRLARLLGDALLGARASNNLASVAHLRGQAARALALYREALLGYQRLGDRRGTAETYHNLGLSFRQLAQWGEADAATMQAIRHAEVAGERSLLALAVMGRAELELERGQFEVAARELARAGDLARESQDEIGVAEVRRLVALLALRQGDLPRAAEEAEAARAEAVRLGSALLAAESAAVAALALRWSGRAAEAVAHRDDALAGFERLGARALAARFLADFDRATPA